MTFYFHVFIEGEDDHNIVLTTFSVRELQFSLFGMTTFTVQLKKQYQKLEVERSGSSIIWVLVNCI